MSRQVDVKALISHIVRGDGADRCRICMGDTSEGQVYLGDTVLMDNDRPVTLSELLEVITGVEKKSRQYAKLPHRVTRCNLCRVLHIKKVPLDGDLPGGLCPSCKEAALAAAAFRNFCRQSTEQWHSAVLLFESLQSLENIEEFQSLYALVKHEGNELSLEGIKLKKAEIKEEQLVDQSDNDSIEYGPIRREKKLIKYDTVGKQYVCPDCEKSFINPKALYDHLKDSTEDKRPCYVCAAIMTRKELVKHLKNVHKSVLFSCKKCPALLRNVNQLRKHLEEAHSLGAHFCGDCGRSFKSEYALRGHTTLHLTKNCPSCDKLFRNRKCYTIHVTKCCNLDMTREDTYHTKTKVLFEVNNIKDNKKLKVGARGSADKECICDYCGKTYAGKKFVSAHIQIVHMKNTHKPCPYCGKSYAAAHMTEHIKRHEKTQSFTCQHCSIIFKSKLGYIQHLRLHTGEKPYKCKYCTETFSASSRRSEHIRKTHKTPDQIILKHCCDYCPAKFRLPSRLKLHVDTVHGENKDNTNDFECPYCHIKFSSCRGLLYHSRSHQTFNFNPPQKSLRLKEQ